MFDTDVSSEAGQGFWDRFLSLFNKGKDEVVRSSKVGKARLDLSSLKKERTSVFGRLGEEIYNRHREKKMSLPGLEPFFAEIDIIAFKISSKEREMKSLRGKGLEVSVPTREDASRRGGIKAETAEVVGRPKKRHYRPKKRNFEARQEVNRSKNGAVAQLGERQAGSL